MAQTISCMSESPIPSHSERPSSAVISEHLHAEILHVADLAERTEALGAWQSLPFTAVICADSKPLPVELEDHDAVVLRPGQSVALGEFAMHRIDDPGADGAVVAARIRAFGTVDLSQLLSLPVVLDGLDALLAELRWERDNTAPLRTAVRRRLQAYRLLDALVAAVPEPDWSVAGIRALGRIAPVLAYIADHYPDPITRGDLARVAGLQLSRFNQVFATAMRVAPMTFVRRYRLQRARALLRTGGESVAAVGQACGFQDQFHFSRSFRAVYGVSPSLLDSR